MSEDVVIDARDYAAVHNLIVTKRLYIELEAAGTLYRYHVIGGAVRPDGTFVLRFDQRGPAAEVEEHEARRN